MKARILIIFSIIGLAFSSGLSSTIIESNIPDVGQRYNLDLSAEKEKLLGQGLLQKLNASGDRVSDPVVNDYLSELSIKLEKAADHLDFKLHLFAINSPELNAFTFFGGHIAVFTGLMLSLEHESELAGVLAHETAHISQRHLARLFTNNKKMMPLTYAELIAAIAIGALGAPEAGSHLATAALGVHMQQMINFTRENEQEADRMGIQILSKAGFDPHALPAALRVLSLKMRYHERPPEYLLTHPIFETRIADCLNRAERIPHQKMPDSLAFHLVRARIETDSAKNVKSLLKKQERRLESNQYTHRIAAEYAYALALAKDKQYSRALDILTDLALKLPNDWMIDLTQAEVEMASGSRETARKRLETLYGNYPNNHSIALRYAEVLLAARDLHRAEQILTRDRKQNPEDPHILQLLVQIFSQLKRPIAVHQTQAEWHYSRGEFKEANAQLDIALEYVAPGSREATRILDRKQSIQMMAEVMKKNSL